MKTLTAIAVVTIVTGVTNAFEIHRRYTFPVRLDHQTSFDSRRPESLSSSSPSKWPPRPNSKLPEGLLTNENSFQRRFGPFEVSDNQKTTLLHHHHHHQSKKELDHVTSNSQLAKRKLMLPVISEGYASTKIEGRSDVKSNVVRVNAVEEQARVQEITAQPTYSTTATTTRTTTTTTQRTTRRRTTTTTTTPRWRAPSTTSTTTTEQPIIVENQEQIPDRLPQSVINRYALRPQFAVPIPKDPEEPVYATRRPPAREEQPVLLPSADIGISPGSFARSPNNRPSKSEPDYDYDEQQGFYTGELITADNNPDGEELVHFSFSQPNQSLTTDEDEEQNGVDFRPSKTDPRTEVYQAGYEQIDVPQSSFGHHPNGDNPEKFDPSQYHEDRPNLTGAQRQSAPEIYPLGKPSDPRPVASPSSLSPKTNQPHPLPPPPPRGPRPHHQKAPFGRRPPRPHHSRLPSPQGAIESFLEKFNPWRRKDNFGPNARPRRPRPHSRPRRPSPPPSTQRPSTTTPQPTLPSGLPVPTPPENIAHLFPPPNELGGALNPIMMKLSPEGIPQLPFLGPKRSNQVLVDRLGEGSPDTMEHSADNEIPGGGSLQVPFVPNRGYSSHRSPPKPQVRPRRPSLPPGNAEFEAIHRQNFETLASYKDKLQDPEFHQNLTNAHVFHSGDGSSNPPIHSPSFGESHAAPVSYIQDSNPFNFQPSKELGSPRIEDDSSFQRTQERADISESPLDHFAPPSRPAHLPISRTAKPDIDIVYDPQVFETAEEVTTITSASPRDSEKDQVTEESSTESFALHVNSMLQRYLSNPDEYRDKGVPNLYLNENNQIVVEYVAPDGEHKMANEDAENEILDTLTAPDYDSLALDDADEEEELELDVPIQGGVKAAGEALDRVHPEPAYPYIESLIASEELILPHELNKDAKDALEVRLSQLFVPSNTPDDSEWFILDNKGRRIMKNRHNKKPIKEEDENADHEKSKLSPEALAVEEGFFPSHGPA